MKILQISAIFIAMMILAVGCSAFHANHNSSGLNVPVTAEIHAQIEVGGDISGQSKMNTLFGFINFGGDTEYADGVSYGASQGAQNPGLLGKIVGGGDAAAPVKSAAALKAVRSGNCDLIVDPRYEVSISDYIVFKSINVTVKGKAGKVTGYTAK